MDQQNMQGPPDDVDFDELDPNGLIGVIKIKDGLFICDELGAQVRTSFFGLNQIINPAVVLFNRLLQSRRGILLELPLVSFHRGWLALQFDLRAFLTE